MTMPEEKPIDLIGDINEAEDRVKQPEPRATPNSVFFDMLRRGPMGRSNWFEQLAVVYYGLNDIEDVSAYQRAAMKRLAYGYSYGQQNIELPVFKPVDYQTIIGVDIGLGDMSKAIASFNAAGMSAAIAAFHMQSYADAMRAFKEFRQYSGRPIDIIIMDDLEANTAKFIGKHIDTDGDALSRNKKRDKVRKSTKTGKTWPKPKGGY